MTLSAFAIAGLLLVQSAPSGPIALGADLVEAAKQGQATKIKELLASGAAVNALDRRGFTPLMWAAAAGQLAAVRDLIDGGAAVDHRAADRTTALMLASANGYLEVVRALILRGADVNAAKDGVTARRLAVERGHADVAALLEQAEALGGRLLRAAVEGHDAAVRQLLASGAPVNVTDERGATALMIAARNGDLGVLQALLSKGADPGIRDASGKGIFEWAEPSVETGKYVTAFLLDRGVGREAPRFTPPADAPPVKASLETLAAILSRISSPSARIRSGQRRAVLVLSQLQALSAQWPAQSPEDYRDNLSEEVKALEAALRTGSVDRVAPTIESIAEDLEVKLEHCNRSGGKLGGSVTVRVHTVQGADEIRSWQVFYMPRVFEAAANVTPDLFPQLSSPTEDTLVPGRYVMWVRDPVTGRVGERTTIKVGEGKKDLVLDLPVPVVR
jgi:hypothetical protein